MLLIKALLPTVLPGGAAREIAREAKMEEVRKSKSDAKGGKSRMMSCKEY